MGYRDPEKESAYRATYLATHRVEERARSAAYYAAHREERNRQNCERSAAMRRDPKTWAQDVRRGIKRRAKILGIEFDLRTEDIQIPTVCPFTLLPFIFGEKNNPQSPSVDRIKPDRGYVRGNVRVISMRANMAKSDVTDPAVFERLAVDAHLWSLV
jgi:hypothetical protein